MNERQIQVYCPDHGIGFEVSAGRSIHCQNKEEEHLLAEKFPAGDFWEYCCDCYRFYPFHRANDARSQRNLDPEQCVSCKRHAIRRYVCEACTVLSVESNEKGPKVYNITATGFVRASKGPFRRECPGCLRPTGAYVNEHHCRKLAVSFTTARSSCPFCRLEIEPDVVQPAEKLATSIDADKMSLGTGAVQNPPVSSSDPGLEGNQAGGVQPQTARLRWPQKIGPQFVSTIRRHGLATATVAAVPLAIAALLLTPQVWGRLIDRKPTVDNIVVYPPVIAPGKEVSLIGIASDPDGDSLIYHWSCSNEAVIDWKNQYAQLKLRDLGLPPKGAPIGVHLRVDDPYGKSDKIDREISVQPPPSNQPPKLRIVTAKQVVGVGERVELKAEAADNEGDSLSYKWNCENHDEAVLSADSAWAMLDTAGIPVRPGPVLLTVSLVVDDGHGNSVSEKVPIVVVSRRTGRATVATLRSGSTNHPFTLSLSPAEKSWVYAGERLKLVATAVAPHKGDALTYQWEANNGCAIEGTGSEVWLNTAVLNPQVDLVVVQVRLTLRDQHGGSIRGITTIFVLPKPTSPKVLPSASPTSMSDLS